MAGHQLHERDASEASVPYIRLLRRYGLHPSAWPMRFAVEAGDWWWIDSNAAVSDSLTLSPTLETRLPVGELPGANPQR